MYKYLSQSFSPANLPKNVSCSLLEQFARSILNNECIISFSMRKDPKFRKCEKWLKLENWGSFIHSIYYIFNFTIQNDADKWSILQKVKWWRCIAAAALNQSTGNFCHIFLSKKTYHFRWCNKMSHLQLRPLCHEIRSKYHGKTVWLLNSVKSWKVWNVVITVPYLPLPWMCSNYCVKGNMLAHRLIYLARNSSCYRHYAAYGHGRGIWDNKAYGKSSISIFQEFS